MALTWSVPCAPLTARALTVQVRLARRFGLGQRRPGVVRVLAVLLPEGAQCLFERPLDGLRVGREGNTTFAGGGICSTSATGDSP
jgi:hypothetical protein